MRRFIYGMHLRRGECFKSLRTASSHVIVLRKNGDKLIIPAKYLEAKFCPISHVARVPDYNSLCPNIRSRSQWNARTTGSATKLNIPVKYFIVHHSATNSCSTTVKCDSRVRGIQNYHIDNQSFGDIGYNFLIGGNGVVYEGRGWSILGVHARSYNPKSFAICMLGNFEKEKPTAAALSSLKRMISCALKKGQISQNYILAGHKDVGSTACPGANLYNIIKKWPHFE